VLQTLARGLQGLLDYDGDVADAFMQPFSIAVVDVFGVPQVHSLKENGDEIIVTSDTRQVLCSCIHICYSQLSVKTVVQ